MSPSSHPEGSFAPQPNYLLFSDVHLGADLVQHTRPWTVSRLREVLRLDRELSTMIAHYRSRPDPERPWTLIIAGDLIDFMGMSISPHADQTLETPLTEEERSHGLGSAQDHVAQKMRAVAERHDLVFRELAQFVAAGHSLVLVRGNHDVEFYWEAARAAFVQALIARTPDGTLSDSAARTAFEARIEFRHWFYYVEGLLYVEHGHQYDATCSHHHMLEPLSPRDPRRIAYSFSDILMRYVVRPTRGMSMSGHDAMGFLDYVKLAFSMGLRGAMRLGYRFVAAIVAMIQVWRDHLGTGAAEMLARQERSMQTIAERVRVGGDKLLALSQLWATPVTGGFSTILRSVFVDMMAAVAGSALLIAMLLWTHVDSPRVRRADRARPRRRHLRMDEIRARDRSVQRAAARCGTRGGATADALRGHGSHAQAAHGSHGGRRDLREPRRLGGRRPRLRAERARAVHAPRDTPRRRAADRRTAPLVHGTRPLDHEGDAGAAAFGRPRPPARQR